jgi:hypothetical protein
MLASSTGDDMNPADHLCSRALAGSSRTTLRQMRQCSVCGPTAAPMQHLKADIQCLIRPTGQRA